MDAFQRDVRKRRSVSTTFVLGDTSDALVKACEPSTAPFRAFAGRIPLFTFIAALRFTAPRRPPCAGSDRAIFRRWARVMLSPI